MKKIKRLLFLILIVLVIICDCQIKFNKFQNALVINPFDVIIEKLKIEENDTVCVRKVI